VKIVSVVGARPQFIKCAPVSRALRKRHEEILVHTGQHYDANMSEVFFTELAIPAPDYHLGVGSGTQGEQTGRMLAAIEGVLLAEEPDAALVYGDTNSTLAGALAAAKLNIPVAHVEAGLRSFDRSMPEEINRVLTDHASTLLFCPTKTAAANLAAEGITEGVHLTGDVMVDALRYNIEVAERESAILGTLGLSEGAYSVATVHRAANTDSRERLAAIMAGLGDIDGPVIFPAHPRTLKYLQAYGLMDALAPTIRLIGPLPYLDMLRLMAGARRVLTDSGGVQKEAYILRVPCITMRENTEWVETVEDGWNVLTGADAEKIARAARRDAPEESGHAGRFGDGRASEEIAALCTGIIS
jgi:UDP-GlcNAc3NAcA epimerase